MHFLLKVVGILFFVHLSPMLQKKVNCPQLTFSRVFFFISVYIRKLSCYRFCMCLTEVCVLSSVMLKSVWKHLPSSTSSSKTKPNFFMEKKYELSLVYTDLLSTLNCKLWPHYILKWASRWIFILNYLHCNFCNPPVVKFWFHKKKIIISGTCFDFFLSCK